MRSPRSPLSGIERRPFECRVRFHAALINARIAPPDSAIWSAAPASEIRSAVPAPAGTPLASPPSTPTAAESPAKKTAPIEVAIEFPLDREPIEKALRGVQLAVTELQKQESSRLEQFQRAAVELAMTMATRLLHQRVSTGEFSMEAKVQDMIAQLGEDKAINVHLNPLDLDVLKARLGGKPFSPDLKDLHLIPDVSLGRCECRVEGRESMLLSEVTRELQEIRDELLRSLGHARA